MKHPLIKFLTLAVIALIIYATTTFYLDSRIPRAIATIQVHPSVFSLNTEINEGQRMTTHYMESEFEIILSDETLRAAAILLNIKDDHQAEAIRLMQENVEVNPVQGTDFIHITAKDPNPKKAAQTANAIAEAYVQRRASFENDRTEGALEALDEELESQRELVETHKAKLASLIQAYPSPLPDENDNLVEPSLRQHAYNEAKENYIQSRKMLRDMKVAQQEARVLLKMPRHPVTIHERAK